jgi:hypothetical protein
MNYDYGMEPAADRLMVREMRRILVLGLALAGFGWALPAAHATAETFDNDTEAAYYSGGSAVERGGSYWDTTAPIGIGAPAFHTPSMSVGPVNNGNNTSTATISFSTGFYIGSTTVGGTTVPDADSFIQAGGGSTPSDSYNYAISLGFDSADGGSSTAGLYALPASNTGNADKTSQQIWSGRSGYVYGGMYAPLGACSTTSNPTSCAEANVSATVLLGNGGSTNEGAAVNVTGSDTPSGSASGTPSVPITASTSLIDSIVSDFDLFWGTADCSNAPF